MNNESHLKLENEMNEEILKLRKQLEIAREALTILSSSDPWLGKNINRKVFINTIFSEMDMIK